MRRALPALVLAVSAATTVLAAAPATAQSLDHQDPSGDVRQGADEAPGNKQADVTSVTFQHRADEVRVTVRLRDLTTDGFRYVGAYVRAGSGAQRGKTFTVAVEAGKGQGAVSLFNAFGDTVTCKSLKHSIGYGSDVVRMVVPRSCLGNPGWVKVGVGTEWRAERDDYDHVFTDDALQDGGGADSAKLSGKIFSA